MAKKEATEVKQVGRYFGTDGFRGKAGDDLTAEHAFKIGCFLGWYFGRSGEKAKIVIGKDTRISSYMFESALASGVASAGGDVFLLHVTTSPCVGYIARTEALEEADAKNAVDTIIDAMRRNNHLKKVRR